MIYPSRGLNLGPAVTTRCTEGWGYVRVLLGWTDIRRWSSVSESSATGISRADTLLGTRDGQSSPSSGQPQVVPQSDVRERSAVRLAFAEKPCGMNFIPDYSSIAENLSKRVTDVDIFKALMLDPQDPQLTLKAAR